MTRSADNISPSTLVIAGDWHGETAWAKRCIWITADIGVSEIVHLGDFGFWPGDSGVRHLDEVEDACAATRVTISVIPGNHDDYDYLESRTPSTNGITHPRPHIRVLPRGHRFTLGGLTVCCVGGAVSVDKAHRKQGVSWWPQEEITAEQETAIIADGPADILLTHDAPTGAATPKLPRKAFLDWVGPHIAAEADGHQNRVARIADALQTRLLVHAHMHARYTDTVTWTAGEGEQYRCTIEGLACDRMNGNLGLLSVVGRFPTLTDIPTPPHHGWR